MNLSIDIECTLCKDTYRNPKILGCLHSFCEECINLHVEKNHSNITPRCPICRSPINLPQNGISELPTNLVLQNSILRFESSRDLFEDKVILCHCEEENAVSYCLDCSDYLCERCTKLHKKGKKTKDDHLVLLEDLRNGKEVIGSSSFFCQLHQEKELELYCKTCESVLCINCLENHQSHITYHVKAALEKEKPLLMELINNITPKTQKLELGIQIIETAVQSLEINSVSKRNEISQLFKKLREALDKRELDLFEKLETIQKSKKKQLDLQSDSLKFGIENINETCSLITKTLTEKKDLEILLMKTFFLSRLETLQQMNFDKDLTPEDQQLHFHFSETLEKLFLNQIEDFGDILETKSMKRQFKKSELDSIQILLFENANEILQKLQKSLESSFLPNKRYDLNQILKIFSTSSFEILSTFFQEDEDSLGEVFPLTFYELFDENQKEEEEDFFFPIDDKEINLDSAFSLPPPPPPKNRRNKKIEKKVSFQIPVQKKEEKKGNEHLNNLLNLLKEKDEKEIEKEKGKEKEEEKEEEKEIYPLLFEEEEDRHFDFFSDIVEEEGDFFQSFVQNQVQSTLQEILFPFPNQEPNPEELRHEGNQNKRQALNKKPPKKGKSSDSCVQQ